MAWALGYSFSRAEGAIECPASAALPHVYGDSNEYTEDGHSVHHFLRRVLLAGREPALAEVTDPALRARFEAIDVSEVYKAGTPVASEVAYALDVEARTARIIGTNLNRRYGALGPNEVAGTTDIELCAPDDIYVDLDTKAGFWGVSPSDSVQLRIQALAISWARGLLRVRVGIFHTPEDREARVRTAELDEDDLDAFAYGLRQAHALIREARALVERGVTPNVKRGPWCRYCPAFASCPDKVGLVRELATSFSAIDVVDGIAAMSPQHAGEAWERWQEIKRTVKVVDRAWSERLERDGRLPLSHGRELALQPTQTRTIDARRALPVLRARFGDAVADRLVEMSISIDAVQEAVRDTKPPRGMLKKSVDAVFAELEAAEAVTRSSYDKPTVRKAS